MIFDGTQYDLYMEGTTDVNCFVRYQIGLILTVPRQSAETNHRYRQGRLPVMDFKGRLMGGQFIDQQTTLPLPTETAFTVFVKNNIFYRVWLDAKTKSEAQKAQTPASQPAGGGQH